MENNNAETCSTTEAQRTFIGARFERHRQRFV